MAEYSIYETKYIPGGLTKKVCVTYSLPKVIICPKCKHLMYFSKKDNVFEHKDTEPCVRFVDPVDYIAIRENY